LGVLICFKILITLKNQDNINYFLKIISSFIGISHKYLYYIVHGYILILLIKDIHVKKLFIIITCVVNILILLGNFILVINVSLKSGNPNIYFEKGNQDFCEES